MKQNLFLNQNLILELDSYKHSHLPEIYPAGAEGMHAYHEGRLKGVDMVPFGLQMWIKKKLAAPITMAQIDEAESFLSAHGEPFDRGMWEHVIRNYDGFLPLTIRGLPEGLVVPGSTPLLTVECVDKRVFPIASQIETVIQSDSWYTTAIASNDLENYRFLKAIYDKYSDNPGMLPFALHDFGGRGVTCEEQRQIGGASHLIFFQGSDTVSGIRAANLYYNCDMAAFSVRATEHSIQCAYGPDRQREYIQRVLDVNAKPGVVFSMVLDAYDFKREVELVCTEFREQIIASGAKLVFRPDSGDMFEIVPWLLERLERAFGTTLNSKGKKVLNYVGIIQGDGIDNITMQLLTQRVISMEFAPENVIFGSGGGLLQKVNRDTYKYAQKSSAILIDGVWEPMFKDPVTDPGKRSKSGRMDDPRFITYYDHGAILVNESLAVIRERAMSNA